jgi:hypothetical protein
MQGYREMKAGRDNIDDGRGVQQNRSIDSRTAGRIWKERVARVVAEQKRRKREKICGSVDELGTIRMKIKLCAVSSERRW